MNMDTLSVPVVLLVFNRPQAVSRVMDVLSEVKPTKLYVVADGPREDHSEDESRCERVRNTVTDIEWDCDLRTNFADENLGLRKRIPSGLSWVFDKEERAIILEDDCVPHLDFFRFCDELLEYFEDDDRVGMISGTNLLGRWKDDKYSYHSVNLMSVWGWATWKSRWEDFDVDMTEWENPEAKRAVQDSYTVRSAYETRWAAYDRAYRGQMETWAYPWAFSQLVRNRRCIIPSRNLVTNVGDEGEGTHNMKGNPFVQLRTYEMKWPLHHNTYIVPDREFSRRVMKKKNVDTAKLFVRRLVKQGYSKIFGMD
jgi:hypothetical protein